MQLEIDQRIPRGGGEGFPPPDWGQPPAGAPRRLVIAPHADDESLGCGGLIAKYPDECAVVVLSDKGDGRLQEFASAMKALGCTRSHVAGFPTGALQARSREVTTELDRIIRRWQPHILYLPTPDAHQDHTAAYECGIRASRLSYTDGSWFVPSVLLYEVPSYSTDLYTTPYTWNHFELLDDEQLDLKIAAIEEYRSQSGGGLSPSDMARSHARYIGACLGARWAEQYAVVRSIEGTR
jgi:LmbE family N-acetylglucosaminyl deacetylase